FSFFANLKDRELSELNSLNEDVRYTFGNIQDSWTLNSINNWNYVYPSIDYGVDERNEKIVVDGQDVFTNWYDNSFDYKNFRPAIKLKSYLQAIFRGFRFDNNIGKWTQLNEDNTKLNQYTYSSALLDNSEFSRLIIPYNKEVLYTNRNGVWANINLPASSFDAGLGRVRVFQGFEFSGFPTQYFRNIVNTSATRYDSYITASTQSNVSVLESRES